MHCIFLYTGKLTDIKRERENFPVSNNKVKEVPDAVGLKSRSKQKHASFMYMPCVAIQSQSF